MKGQGSLKRLRPQPNTKFIQALHTFALFGGKIKKR